MRRALGMLVVVLAGCSAGIPDGGPGPGCTPKTCQPDQCGELLDGCTGILRCGTCAPGTVCGGGGTPNVCGRGTCIAKTCFELGKNCNFVSDGCSKLLDCGRCMRPSDCGANGKPNVCGSVSCIRALCGPNCGIALPDDCGGTVQCDAGCPGRYETCGGGGTANRCGCTPRSCAELGKNCGSTDDGCGTTLQCGTCGADAGTCGGGGAENVCGTCGNTGGRVCSGSCWCSELPRPMGVYGAITGTGPDDVWLFGGAGVFAHGSAGAGFSGLASGTRGAPRNAWAADANDVWVTTSQLDGGLSHWDGVKWSAVGLPTPEAMSAVWGTGGEVWTAGSNGTILRGVNGAWTSIASGGGYAFDDIWASGPDDVWIGGTTTRRWTGAVLTTPVAFTLRITDFHGTARNDAWAVDIQRVWHFDGTTWAISYTGFSMRRVWAIARDDVWIGGIDGHVAHYDGTKWTDETLGTTDDVSALWASGPGEVWAGAGSQLWRRDATGWHIASTGPVGTIRSIHAVSATDAWAVHDNGVLRFDGGWRPVFSGLSSSLTGVAGAGGRVWVYGINTLLSWRGDRFVSEARTDAGTESYTALFAVSETEAYALTGAGRVLRTDGSGSWTPLTAPAPALVGAASLWATSDHDLWLGQGLGRTQHLTDAGWTQVNTGFPGTVRVWGSGSEVFAAVNNTALRLGVDGGWEPLANVSGVQLNAVWGRSATEVYFAGSGGSVSRWDGVSLSPVPSGTTHDLFALGGDPASVVWAGGMHRTVVPLGAPVSRVYGARLPDTLAGIAAFGRDDVWAIGQSSTPHHFDGQSWRTYVVPGASALDTVWGTGPNDVWAVGSTGRIAHWDGGAWSSATNPLGSFSGSGIWGAQPDEVWIVGDSTLGRWNGVSWIRETLPVNPISLSAVHGTSRDDVWVAGAQLYHFNGQQWTATQTLPKRFTSMWCASRTDCWGVGPTPVTMRFNGTSWNEVTSPCRSPSVVWGGGHHDVYIFCTDGDAYRWDGVKFAQSFTGATSQVLAASSFDGGVWAVGRDFVLLQPR